MSFRMWFRSWRRAFWRLFKIGNSPYKSEKQRECEHEKRMKAKHSRKGKYRVAKKRVRRRGGNYKALSAVVGFFATTLSILLLPFGLLHWGYKNAKKRSRTRMTNPKPTPASSRPLETQQKGTVRPEATEPHSNVTPTNPRATDRRANVAPTTHTSVPKPPAERKIENAVKEAPPTSQAYQPIATPIILEEPAVLDENTPKSSPKNPKDQYIRKRMLIAGTSYCDSAILARLTVGKYLDVVAEPDNPHDKNAVKLLLDGEKVGYIPQKDNLPYVTSLKLGRKVYGVVTDVVTNDSRAEYEFETWLDRA